MELCIERGQTLTIWSVKSLEMTLPRSWITEDVLLVFCCAAVPVRRQYRVKGMIDEAALQAEPFVICFVSGLLG